MAFETRDMSGALFRVREKTNPKGPDMTGNLVIGGVKYRLAGWTQEAGTGKYLSLKVQPADEPKPAPKPTAKALDDDIPF